MRVFEIDETTGQQMELGQDGNPVTGESTLASPPLKEANEGQYTSPSPKKSPMPGSATPNNSSPENRRKISRQVPQVSNPGQGWPLAQQQMTPHGPHFGAPYGVAYDQDIEHALIEHVLQQELLHGSLKNSGMPPWTPQFPQPYNDSFGGEDMTHYDAVVNGVPTTIPFHSAHRPFMSGFGTYSPSQAQVPGQSNPFSQAPNGRDWSRRTRPNPANFDMTTHPSTPHPTAPSTYGETGPSFRGGLQNMYDGVHNFYGEVQYDSQGRPFPSGQPGTQHGGSTNRNGKANAYPGQPGGHADPIDHESPE